MNWRNHGIFNHHLHVGFHYWLSHRVNIVGEMKLYRLSNRKYAAPLDEWESPIGEGQVYISLDEFDVLRKTPCGEWIDYYGREKFVNRNSRKRFASASIEDAVISFRRRKERQIKILSAQLKDANKALVLLDYWQVPKWMK